MDDKRFDDEVRKALTYEPGLPSEKVWSRVRATKLLWLPTALEIIVAGAASAAAILVMGLSHGGAPARGADSPTVADVLHSDSAYTVAAVARVYGSEPYGFEERPAR